MAEDASVDTEKPSDSKPPAAPPGCMVDQQTVRPYRDMHMKRLLLAALTMLFIIALSPGAALAGGSWLNPIETDIRPGDTITMVGFSGFGPRQDPTVSTDDPFYAYLEIDKSQRTSGYPNIHDGMIALGQLTVDATGECCWQNYRLHITFTVPLDLDDGHYNVVHCNDPCTTNFGELVGGNLYVGDTPEGWEHPAEVSLDNPLVADLVETNQQLALTGPTHTDLFWVGAILLVAGRVGVRLSERLESRPR